MHDDQYGYQQHEEQEADYNGQAEEHHQEEDAQQEQDFHNGH